MLSGARRDLYRRSLAAVALLPLAALLALLWRALVAAGIDLSTLDERGVEHFVAAWGAWSALISVGVMVLHSFLPLPAEIIPIANGMLFGAVSGVMLTWLGAMLGAVLSFALARKLGRPFVRFVVSERNWERLAGLSPRPSTLLVVRLIPVISFNLVNYAAGLTAVPWWTFLWTTALGILPLTAAMVVMGGQILRAPLWAWPVVAGAVLLLWLWLRRWRRAQQTH
jgi:uncharacterized membrane protein YdjX (TVP38/TMEM64 family)